MSVHHEHAQTDEAVGKLKRMVLTEAMSKEAWESHKENHLALAGASFAAIVALACLSKLEGWLMVSLYCFAIGLPVNVDLYIKSRRSVLHYAKIYLDVVPHMIRVAIGTITVNFGIGSLIAYHSPTAACFYLLAAAYIVFYPKFNKVLGRPQPRLDDLLRSHLGDMEPTPGEPEQRPAQEI